MSARLASRGGKAVVFVRAPEHPETTLEISEQLAAIGDGELGQQAFVRGMSVRLDLLDDAGALRGDNKPASTSIRLVSLLAHEPAILERVDDGADRRLRQTSVARNLGREHRLGVEGTSAEVRITGDLEQYDPLLGRDPGFGCESFASSLEVIGQIEQDEDNALVDAGCDRNFRTRGHVAASFAQIALGCAIAACASPKPAVPHGASQLTTEQLVRLRCATDGREVVMAWQGRVDAHVPNEPARALFRVVGMNVARCVEHQGAWHLTSRELMYYLDPQTGERLDTWPNPWTGKSVPVVHVANGLVQNELGGPIPFEEASGKTSVRIDIDLAYPNPLAKDPALSRFSPTAVYKASEHFVFTASTAALTDRKIPMVPAVSLRWTRTGPWLPWMDMGDRPGELVYESEGRRVDRLDDLPAVLREEIATRVPLFAHAPVCVTAGHNVTSWTYFAVHLGEYLRGDRFPTPAPVHDEECAR